MQAIRQVPTKNKKKKKKKKKRKKVSQMSKMKRFVHLPKGHTVSHQRHIKGQVGHIPF